MAGKSVLPVIEASIKTDQVDTVSAVVAEDENDAKLMLPMSKTQIKKDKKRERAAEKKKHKKDREKEAKRAQAEAQGRNLEAEEEFRLQRTAAGDGKRWRQTIWDTEKLPLAEASFQICLDCSFEENMTDKEIASLASQIRYCYSYNKRAAVPSIWAATDLRDGSKTLSLLKKETGYAEWPNRAFTGTSESLPDYYRDRMHSIVYLTSDSENIITALESDKIYVIGGIVDRNRWKGVALQRAQELGVVTAKLPLAEHLIHMPATKVLTCNHVFDILLKFQGECHHDWGQALRAVLPSRKEAKYIETIVKKTTISVATSEAINNGGDETTTPYQPT